MITEVGAGLCSFTVDDTEVLAAHGPDQAPKSRKGVHLFPRSNRLCNGRHHLGGQEFQLPINGSSRNSADHGLNVGPAWECLAHLGTSTRQQHILWPRCGWPGVLTVEILHQLEAQSLRVEVIATNVGATPISWSYGAHPYFRFEDISSAELTVPSDAKLAVGPERLSPIHLGPIAPAHDFIRARTIEEAALDATFIDPLTRDWIITLSGDGRTVEVWDEATTQWVQVFTTPHHDSVAVEPMICGSNALNEGPTYRSRTVLWPEGSARATWGIRAALQSVSQFGGA